MTTHDTAESLQFALDGLHEPFSGWWVAADYGTLHEIAKRAISRLALLERGIERADKQCCVLDHWRDADSPDFRSSLLALIEELGVEP